LNSYSFVRAIAAYKTSPVAQDKIKEFIGINCFKNSVVKTNTTIYTTMARININGIPKIILPP